MPDKKVEVERLKQEAIEEIQTWSTIQMQQVQMWAQSLERYCTRMETGNQLEETFSSFWIRLYETFDEIKPYFTKTVRTLESLIPKAELTDIHSRHGNTYALYSSIIGKITEIEGKFSRDELITIEYERHCKCHVFQEGYLKRGHIKSDGSFAFKRIERAGLTIEEIQEAIQRTLRANRNGFGRVDESYMAEQFSGRIIKEVRELTALIDQWIS